MKKILSVTLCILILAGLCSTPMSASAYTRPDPPFEWNYIEDEDVISTARNSYIDFLFKEYPEAGEYLEEEAAVWVVTTQDEATVFLGAGLAAGCVETSLLVGQYVFFNGGLFGAEFKNPIGLYAMDNQGVTFDITDAYEAGIVDIDDVAAHFPYSTKLSDREYDVITTLGIGNDDFAGCYYHYEELFLVTTDEEGATPDYVLIEIGQGAIYEGAHIEVIGDYVVSTRTNYQSGALPYYVYLKNGELLTLREAADRGLTVIEDAVWNSDIPCALKGDADGDGVLTVKDATYLQKKLADFRLTPAHTFDMAEVVEDFDEDKKLTVKDATAIQKKIAGFEEDNELDKAIEKLEYLLERYCTEPFDPGYNPEIMLKVFAERDAAYALLERENLTAEETNAQYDALYRALSALYADIPVCPTF